MSTALIDLEDRVITDTGSMVAKHKLLVNLALAGEPFATLPFVGNDDTDRYHHYNNSKDAAKRWVDDGNPQGPSLSTFDWTFPSEYAELDIDDRCRELMTSLNYDGEEYIDRLETELELLKDRNMTNFIRCLVWITDVMREKGLVWGLGRGSSCASFILFLLGVNKVDPVRYDIPMEEFYK